MNCIKISLKNLHRIMEAFEKYKTVRRFCWGILGAVFLYGMYKTTVDLIIALLCR